MSPAGSWLGSGRERHGAERRAGGALCGEAPGLVANDGHGPVVAQVERDGVENGCACGVAPGDDRDGVARHQVARIETAAQRPRDRIGRGAIDAVTQQNAAQRIVAPHRHLLALVAEHHLGQRDRPGEGDPRAVRRVAALRSARRLDVAVLAGLDTDRDRDAPALAVGAEQQPHLAADAHAPQVRPLLDGLADPVGVHGAHAGPAQQEGEAVAATDTEGLQLRLGFDRRRREGGLHRRRQTGRNQGDQRERRDPADPAARLAIATPNRSLHHTRVRRFVSSTAANGCRHWRRDDPLSIEARTSPFPKCPSFRYGDACSARPAPPGRSTPTLNA